MRSAADASKPGYESGFKEDSVMLCRMVVIATLLFAMFVAPTQAQPDSSVQVSVAERESGLYIVTGSFVVPAAGADAWKVLANYDQLGSYIPSMKSSIVKRGIPGLFVAQETTAYFLSIPRTTRVVLQIDEEAGSEISFTDVALEDFELFKGSWKLKSRDGYTQVSYDASAKPKINLPFWGKSIFTGTVRSLLTDLRNEILRRKTAVAS